MGAEINLSTIPPLVLREIVEMFENHDRVVLSTKDWGPTRDYPNSHISRYFSHSMQEQIYSRLMKSRRMAWDIVQNHQNEMSQRLHRNRMDVLKNVNTRYDEDCKITKLDNFMMVLSNFLDIASDNSQRIQETRRNGIVDAIRRFFRTDLHNFEALFMELLQGVDTVAGRPTRHVPNHLKLKYVYNAWTDHTSIRDAFTPGISYRYNLIQNPDSTPRRQEHNRVYDITKYTGGGGGPK